MAAAMGCVRCEFSTTKPPRGALVGAVSRTKGLFGWVGSHHTPPKRGTVGFIEHEKGEFGLSSSIVEAFWLGGWPTRGALVGAVTATRGCLV
ncbi:hypothetical protein Tco_1500416 [Tanacetum coccineum]